MNAGIVNLEDGSPCIAYDEELPRAVTHIVFNEENHQITLMYDEPDAEGRIGYEFPFPLDPPFTALLRERGDVAIAFVKNKQLVDIAILSVVFTTL